LKRKKSQNIGINFKLKNYAPKDYQLIVNDIKKLNMGPSQGIMIQLPLPENFLPSGITQQEFLDLIDPERDIDGLHSHSLFIPATVKGVLAILEAEKIDSSLLIAVVGSEGLIGKSMVRWLGKKGFKVMEVDRNTKFTIKDLHQADVIISCTGVPSLIKPSEIKEGSVLIDVGLGDFDSECYKKASRYTESSGGVGPMTVISLMENVVMSYSKN
jgi:methylenetetrahydrofolate dehydrogenase (NADP+)/methenyltetrahydrofolate cyclohydrolase